MTVNAEFAHAWDLEPSEAISLQKRLAEYVVRAPALGTVEVVGGVDAGYKEGTARAAVVTFSYPALEMLDYVVTTRPIAYPYVPGLLSFREAPAVLETFETLETVPDLLIFDAQGIAHPRRFGLASHVGLLLDLPAIGCAKRRLCGSYEVPHTERGSFTYLREDDEVIGAVVRTRTGVKPVFVSIGHRVDLPTAVDYVLGCGGGYKLPEPTRWADKIAGGARPPIKEEDVS